MVKREPSKLTSSVRFRYPAPNKMSQYVKEVFEPGDLEYAKHVVLTSDPNNPNKFKYETDFLIRRIRERNIITAESVVVDFGCGMGRVSRALLEAFDCHVIGVDFSEVMLKHARNYVGKTSKFETHTEYAKPSSVDVVVCTFVLQHVEHPVKEIHSIYTMLKPGGTLVLVNENQRLVPLGVQAGMADWINDGFDVFEQIEKLFEQTHSQRYMNTDHKIIYYKK